MMLRRHLVSCAAKSPIFSARSLSTGPSRRPPSFQRNAIYVTVGCLTTAGLITWYNNHNGGDGHRRTLSYEYFIPLRISAIQQITPGSSLISVSLPQENVPDSTNYPEPPDTPLQAIYVRQPELQIQRAYTPLDVECFNANTNTDRSIQLLVKRYKDGEVSDYMHRQNEGDEIWIRGPVRTWTLPPADELIFIAGGTGLTPLIQLLSHRKSLPQSIKLLFCSSRDEKSFLSLLPDQESCSITHVEGRLQLAHLKQHVGTPNTHKHTHIVVCGPEGFITDIAGKRGLDAQTDRVGGMLAQLGWTEEYVKKL